MKTAHTSLHLCMLVYSYMQMGREEVNQLRQG
jgi:hypothetical protein